MSVCAIIVLFMGNEIDEIIESVTKEQSQIANELLQGDPIIDDIVESVLEEQRKETILVNNLHEAS